jgi:integrase
MRLTDTFVRNVKKSGKYADGHGGYLLVTKTLSKLWRQKYRRPSLRVENTLTHGIYPAVPLAEFRKRLAAALELLARGVDPSEYRKVQKAAIREQAKNTFESIAREWFAKYKPNWATSHSDKVIARLENDVFPWLGSRPIAQIRAPEVLSVLRRIEGRGALDTAHRALQNISAVFRYAIATGRAERDPSPDLRGALPPAKHEHFAAITDPKLVGALLRAIDAFQGSFVVQCALRLAPMLFVRPGELRKAMWKDFDLERGEWVYVATKTKTEHVVPLAPRALAVLKDLRQKTGHGIQVFPGRDPKKPMSDAAVNAALRRMGYDTRTEICGHGFRAMARTILHEQLGFAPEIIEHQLAHRVPDQLGSAYNRTRFLQQRREMMIKWCGYLDELRAGAKVVALHTVAA